MVGIGAATTDKDSIITSYRDHCTHLVKGGTLLEVRPFPVHRAASTSCASRTARVGAGPSMLQMRLPAARLFVSS
jgi:TPP-dependent pyruvate/acetoin dehydrogenase alpha subunit